MLNELQLWKIIKTRGLFHKTLQIRKLWICSYGQILTVNLLINCKNSVIYGKMAVNYEGTGPALYVLAVMGDVKGATVVAPIEETVELGRVSVSAFQHLISS